MLQQFKNVPRKQETFKNIVYTIFNKYQCDESFHVEVDFLPVNEYGYELNLSIEK